MKTVRRSSWEQGIRINYVAPCWIKSAIRSKEYETWLMERGIEFGEQEDCAGAMMRIACDKSVNGTSSFCINTFFLLLSWPVPRHSQLDAARCRLIICFFGSLQY